MTSASAFLSGTATKAAAPTPKKLHPSLKNNPKEPAFENKLKSSISSSEDPDKKDVTKQKNKSNTTSDETQNSTEDPSETTENISSQQVLNPIQILIATSAETTSTETESTTSTTEGVDCGNIFQEEEKNSTSLSTLTQATPLTQKSSAPLNQNTGITLSEQPEESLTSSSTFFDIKASAETSTEKTTSENTLESLKASIPQTEELSLMKTRDEVKAIINPNTPQETTKLNTLDAKPEFITLSSQHRLETVLDSVFEEKPVPTPRRIEVKLQTPHGAQVTLSIARVNQELRAQFSANSAQAFSWLQSEIHQLKSVSFNESIRWLPAQMESLQSQVASSTKTSDENLSQDKDRDEKPSLESIFDIFKPSTRRLA